MSSLFGQALVYLGAGLVAVPLAKRLGLGSVLGYLLAGVAIGPHALSLVGDAEDVMHFSEFGVVMMLFLVGLELEPARLWRMRGPIFGLGGLQVLATALLIGCAAMLGGLSGRQALALGFIMAMSSTAIALQSLEERGLRQSDAGQKSFAILLFQDVSVIPLLALFPLLATEPVKTGAETAIAHLGPAGRAGATLLAVLGVAAGGRFLVPGLMRVVARSGMRELFTAAALAIVIAVTLLMGAVGLSPALGAFLAGVALANSEYRHELEGDLLPWKGLLLGLFFMAVGASVDVPAIAAAPLRVGALVGVVVLLKAGALLALARVWGASADQRLLLAAALAQVGEFAFVLLSFAAQTGVLPQGVASTGVAVTASSMALAPLLLVLTERVLLPRLREDEAPTRAPDTVDERNAVIVAGFGRFGQICARFLRSHGIPVTVLEVDSDQVDTLKKFGAKAYYGDASRIDLLEAAGAKHAKMLIVAVDQPEKVIEIVEVCRRHYPHLVLFARARGRTEAYDLIERGVAHVYRETFESSLRLGEHALGALGHHPHRAHRAAQLFRKHDEAGLRALAKLRNDEAALIRSAREWMRALEEALKGDAREAGTLDDEGWDNSPLREMAEKRTR
jgi:monovalent cation:proton antiporter-2 (CPA2) family protein